MKEMNEQYYLFIDTDDVLIDSSTLIQSQVDSHTPFKTTTLKMYEQLSRNCKYYANEVEKECKLAYKEKRLPKLYQFPNLEKYDFGITNFNFNELDSTKISHIYENPVDFANYYVKIANKILEQFLEERDIFLETDNLSFGEKKNVDYEQEKYTLDFFIKTLKNNREAFVNINYYCLREIKRIIDVAKLKGDIPKYGALIKIDHNDIIRTNSISSSITRDELLYEKPITDVSRCIIYEDALEDIIKNFPLMMNESREVINYDNKYKIKNVNWEAKKAIEVLVNSGLIKAKYNISHHNGLREHTAKERFIYSVLSNTKFIGMRFHGTEHKVVRRFRSSKMEEALKLFPDIEPSRMILLDDSIDNCRDWENKGGRAILYRKLTDSEIVRGHMEDTGLTRITKFDGDELVDIVNSYKYNKTKRYGVKNG